MTKQEILDILDQNAASNRKALKITIGVGVACLLASAALFIFVEEAMWWEYILGGVGILFISGSVIRLKNNSSEKDAERIKDVFNNRPQDLVWSYTLETKSNIGQLKQTILKFRDGTQFEIAEDAIPSKDCNDLVKALTVINPKMVVGYSEETEKLYKEKAL